jgi:hypothetical protein
MAPFEPLPQLLIADRNPEFHGLDHGDVIWEGLVK